MGINKTNTHIIPFEFKYFTPTDLKSALKLLSTLGGQARLLAGGTDLIVQMKQRLIEPQHIINIKKIDELTGIQARRDKLHIGAATKLKDLERSTVVRDKFPLLFEAVKSIGSVQIRNMATIGGNLCNASPAGDAAVSLFALNAIIQITSQKATRRIPIQEFFQGPGQTILEPDEILTMVSVPNTPDGTGSAFIKIGRTNLDIAIINIATILTLKNDVIEQCRVALGSVAPTPIRAKKTEAFLSGKKLTSETLNASAEIASGEINPITDIRATAEYRYDTSKVLIKEALILASKNARKG